MSDDGPGFFYYRCIYRYPWTDQISTTIEIDENFHTAVYTPVPKQDHAKQTTWLKNCALPAVEADIRKWHIGMGRNYEKFNQVYIKQQDFKYYKTLPQYTTGPLKGQPFGRQI
ncbi:hypothetical protein FE257_008832 [Aspergillus nanangensis]|uniref:Uncharacterized protein n=1 Tax=Aspergillus nanangensis TaxID=2582783 RepID=A0AAD4CL65_ASPNN|nr:hypothetical protein FE257_008832 [Aspergillus nanangensis]